MPWTPTTDLGSSVIVRSLVVSGSTIYVVKPDQTVELRPISVARAADAETVIKQGLTPGETVVTDGQLRLTAGSRVSVKSGPGTKVTP